MAGHTLLKLLVVGGGLFFLSFLSFLSFPAVACMMSEEGLAKEFSFRDKNGDGGLSLDEYLDFRRSGLYDAFVEEKERDRFLTDDKDHSGMIEKSEFVPFQQKC